MKKLKNILSLLTIIAMSFVAPDVFACGEINSLETNVGTIGTINESNFLITVPAGTKEVILKGQTDYEWVEGFAPRRVPVGDKIEIKVNGNVCGYGIYTYFVHFKEQPTTIAENTDPVAPAQSDPAANTTPDSTATPTEPTAPQVGTEGETVTGSSNLILKKLEIPSYKIDFDPYKYEYEIEVDLSVTSLDIVAEPEDENASVSVSANIKELKEGENLIAITVMDALNNTNIYQLKVNRVEPKSNNNYLASITIEGHQLNFNPSVTYYKLETGKVSKLDIKVITESELANYEILGNSGLTDGSAVTIRVTAEDGSKRDYIINISRVFNIMDYWIYIVIVLLLLLLLIILLIMKKNKQKKKMGPQTIEGNKETAGVIQEIAPQNITQTAAPEQNSNLETVSLGETKGTLKIIEPTNIETPTSDNPNPIDEEKEKTEVFQL